MTKPPPEIKLVFGMFADDSKAERGGSRSRLLGVILKASDDSGDYYLRLTKGTYAFQTLGPYHSLDSAKTNAHLMCQTDIVVCPWTTT